MGHSLQKRDVRAASTFHPIATKSRTRRVRRKARDDSMFSPRESPFERSPIFQRLIKPTSKVRAKAPAAARVRTGVVPGVHGCTERPKGTQGWGI
jgi:hypothetical protein